MSSVQTDYISASTNRHSHAADAGAESLIVFGSSKVIALWNAEDPCDRGVYETLPGHDGLVTCVRFIPNDLLVSTDDLGVVRLWRKNGSQWKSVSVTQAHNKAISALEVYNQYVITGASDSTVKIWTLPSITTSGELQELQIISLGGKYPLSLALSTLPGTQATVLAVGSTDRNIQIWARSEDMFVLSTTLSGHEDWVRSLSFRPPLLDGDVLILASGSQDSTIRLWNFEPYTKPTSATPTQGQGGELSDELLDAFEASLADLDDGEEGGRQISLKRHILTVKTNAQSSQQFSITFDALLVGHEAGVTSLSWRPQSSVSSTPTLMSTSTDSSLILWSPSTILTSLKDGSTSLWINRQRFGDIGGQRLGGFVGGLWAHGGMDALAWGWSGGWRRFRCNTSEQNESDSNRNEEWAEVGAISGHSAAVRGLAWSPGGEYLISAGLDQTTRIHGGIPALDKDGASISVWHELSRPQVHGYDLVGVVFLDALRFVSIADEKAVRVFEAPREFVDVINNLGVAQLVSIDEERPRAAAVPPLGLSNRAIAEGNSEEGTKLYDIVRTRRRPFEGELAVITLWPEIEKIFGHGYESIALAVSNSKRFIATACKATVPEHAVIRVHDTENWQLFGQPLAGHSLTVTQIAFSPDDRFILSVSRDRTWHLFEKEKDGYSAVAADKSHGRIIWDCAWAHEGDVFATASRDKTVKIWHPKNAESSSKWSAVATIQAKAAATAVAFAPEGSGLRKLAIGLESGDIMIHVSEKRDLSDWKLVLTIDSHYAHIDHIHHLMWRPCSDSTAEQLASCSEDGTLKVLTVHIAGTE